MNMRHKAPLARFGFAVPLLLAGALGSRGGARDDIRGDEGMPLTRDGEAAAVIVLAAEPTRVAQLAAFELQWHIEQITGARLDIAREPRDDRRAIVVGDHPLAAAAGLSDWEPGEYVIHFTEDALFLAGDDSPTRGEVKYDLKDPWVFMSWPALDEAQGTLHATYAFLERHANVRWWNPTEFGIDLPATPDLTVAGRNLRGRPAFAYREIPGMTMAESYDAQTQYWHRDDPEYRAYLEAAYPALLARWNTVDARWRGWMQLWMMRMKLGGGERYRANHSFYGWYERFLDKDHEHFEGHRPYLFAQGYDNHARPPNPCFTHPATLAQTIADARAYFDHGGYTRRESGVGQLGYFWGKDYFAVVPNDSAHCQCANCLALTGPASPFFSRGEHSNEVFGFVNQVARALKETHPDKYLATLAYAGYARYPDNVRLEDNIAVQVCLHIRHVYDRAIQENDRRILREWVANEPGRRIYLWLYYTFPLEMGKLHPRPRWHVFPGFFARHIAESFKLYHAMGIRGAFFNGFAQGLDAYLTLRMLHDPAEDVGAIMDEYFHRQYGAAGEPLKRFYLTVEDIYGVPSNYPVTESARGQPNTPGIIGHQTREIAWGRLGTPERMDVLKALIEEAHALARTEVEKRRVALFDLSVWQYMRHAVYREATTPNLETWPDHPATLVLDRSPTFDAQNALRGKPFVLETPGALLVIDAETRAGPNEPFFQLTDGHAAAAVHVHVPRMAQADTLETTLRCDLGPAVADGGGELRNVRVFWRVDDPHWRAAFRIEARAAASGTWTPITRDFVFDAWQRVPGGFCRLSAPFPPGGVTGIDALRLVDQGNRMIVAADWHWMSATRFMEMEADIVPAADPAAQAP